ncbi:hypothetical protein JCM11641_000651 [Rhodosporidiobolus odoratus]
MSRSSLRSTAYLPTLRISVYSLLVFSSLLNLVLSAALLGYQLAKTYGGYNKPVPSLLVGSALTLAHCIVFMSPVGVTASSKRRRLLSLQVEILSLAVFFLFTLASVGRLHTSTPGLMSSCGGYITCIALQGCFALGWLSFLFLLILFTSIFGSTLYHHRRSRDKSIWLQPFSSFAWYRYAPQAARRVGNNVGGTPLQAKAQKV